MIFSDKVYTALKWITMIALPALATLYFALAGIWDFPYGEEVVGTIAAITTCLGALIGISSFNYNEQLPNVKPTDGAIIVESFDDIAGSSYIQFEKDLDNLKDQSHITLKVLSADQLDGEDA